MINTTYEPFSREPEYLELNGEFIQCVVSHLKVWDCIVDIACGTGTLTDLLLAELKPRGAVHSEGAEQPKTMDRPKVIGIDLSRGSLKIAKDHFRQLSMLVPPKETYDGVRIVFVEASGDRLPMTDAVADIVLLGNAIHCFTDKDQLLREVYRVLRPGGVFAFNSSFYAGTILEGTERFYEEWMKEAFRYINRLKEERGYHGMGGDFRKRRRGRPAFSNRWWTAAEYRQALDKHGFDIIGITKRILRMSRRNFEAVGAYADLASVLLSGYPVELACEALQKAVGPAFEAAGVERIPRSWLEMIGIKR